MPPLLGGKGTAHAGSTWVTCQIRGKNYRYRTPSEGPYVCVGSVQVAPLSLYATVLSSKVVLASVSRHRAGVRATVPAEEEEEEEEGLFKANAVN